MSIGVLGFVVWSQWLAFHICEDMVINSTVGWNGLLFLFLFLCYCTSEKSNTKLGNLLDTFYSLNANKSAQSAGNLQKGSSETIRGNTYDLFKKNFYSFFKKDFSKDNNWLSWFIGFLEGDGAILEYKGRCYFVLTQKDDTVLHEIYETLNIGIVKHFYDNAGNKKYSRYIVADNKSIFLLYLLLNGNLVLQSRVNQLSRWSIALSNAIKFNYSLFYTKEITKHIKNTKKPSLNDSWLSGFTDAEGCFSVKIGKAKNNFYVSILFLLDQKNEEIALNEIGLLFSKNVSAKIRTPNLRKNLDTVSIKPIENMYRLSLSCNSKEKTISSDIINYFNRYNLKTNKKNSFRIWCEILDLVVGKGARSPETLAKIRKLRHNMNYYTIKNKTIGHSNKS